MDIKELTNYFRDLIDISNFEILDYVYYYDKDSYDINSKHIYMPDDSLCVICNGSMFIEVKMDKDKIKDFKLSVSSKQTEEITFDMDILRQYGLTYIVYGEDFIFTLERNNVFDSISIPDHINKIVYGKNKEYNIEENTLYFCHSFESDNKYKNNLEVHRVSWKDKIVFISKEDTRKWYHRYYTLFGLKYLGSSDSIEENAEFVDKDGNKLRLYPLNNNDDKVLFINEYNEMILLAVSSNYMTYIDFIFCKVNDSRLKAFDSKIDGELLPDYIFYMDNGEIYNLYIFSLFNNFIKYLNCECDGKIYDVILSNMGSELKSKIMFITRNTIPVKNSNIINHGNYTKLGSFIIPVENIEDAKRIYDQMGYYLIDEKSNDDIYIAERFKSKYSVVKTIKKEEYYKSGKI